LLVSVKIQYRSKGEHGARSAQLPFDLTQLELGIAIQPLGLELFGLNLHGVAPVHVPRTPRFSNRGASLS
jgi:hypothetical protein